MKVLGIQNPRKTKSGGYDVEVLFEEIGQYIPYHATSTDQEEHGIEIYTRVSSGEFGVVEDYAEPTITIDQFRLKAISEVNRMFAEKSNQITINVSEAEQKTWTYQAVAADAFINGSASDRQIEFLSSICTADETVEDIALKIITKSNQVQLAAGQLLSFKRTAEKEIEVAKEETSVTNALNEFKDKLAALL